MSLKQLLTIIAIVLLYVAALVISLAMGLLVENNSAYDSSKIRTTQRHRQAAGESGNP